MCVLLNMIRVSPESCLFDEIVTAYNSGADYADINAYLRAPGDIALRALREPRAITSSDIIWTEIFFYTASSNSIPLAL